MPPEAEVPGSLLGAPQPDEGALIGIRTALGEDPDLVVTVVGPPELAEPIRADCSLRLGERVLTVPATRGVGPGRDAPREVRAHRDAAVRVAARMVRDGRADAMVSAAPAEAVVAAAHFTLGLLPGATRPSLAVVVEGGLGPVVLCDAGATASTSADELVQFALAGSAFATAKLGVARPRVGLLSARPALVDSERRAADEVLRTLDVGYVGLFGADALAVGSIDVAVTDGVTGDLLLAGASPGLGRDTAAVVLGLSGVALCVHTTTPDAGAGRGPAVGPATSGAVWAQAVATAATARRTALVENVRSAMSGLLARRRVAAGMAR